MNHRTTRTASGLLAVAVAIVSPTALAQQGAPQTAPQTAPQSDAAQPATPARKTWAELDLDRNGSLSREETAAVPSLQAVFERADGNADGALTSEEYKAYLAANDKAAQGKSEK